MVSRFTILFIMMVVGASQVFAQGRKPANFIPDDDMIIVPLYIENKSMLQKVQEEHQENFKEQRRIVHTWILNEEYARGHGLEGRGIIPESTVEERQRFLNRNFLRFFTKRVENNAKTGLKSWWEDVSASDEIDSIDLQETRSEYLVKSSNSKTNNLAKEETINVGKQKFKFGVQPRVEMGSVRFTAEGFGFRARAWVGINGDQEIYVEKVFSATRTRVLANYYWDEKKTLAAVDQPIGKYTSLRLAHQKDDDFTDQDREDGYHRENNSLEIRFSMGF